MNSPRRLILLLPIRIVVHDDSGRSDTVRAISIWSLPTVSMFQISTFTGMFINLDGLATGSWRRYSAINGSLSGSGSARYSRGAREVERLLPQ